MGADARLIGITSFAVTPMLPRCPRRRIPRLCRSIGAEAEPMRVSEHRGFRAIRGGGLRKDAAEVMRDSVRRDFERARDLPVRLAGSDEH